MKRREKWCGFILLMALLVEGVSSAKTSTKEDILKINRGAVSCGLKKSKLVYKKAGCEDKGSSVLLVILSSLIFYVHEFFVLHIYRKKRAINNDKCG